MKNKYEVEKLDNIPKSGLMYGVKYKEGICDECGGLRVWCPDDYKQEGCEYPTECVHCRMPWYEVFGDIYREEGLVEATRDLLKRLTYKK